MDFACEKSNNIYSLSRSEIRNIQDTRLPQIVQYAYEHSTFYKELYDSVHISPANIKTAGDLEKLPTISKKELRLDIEANPIFGRMLAVPEREIVFTASSSGTCGRPMISPFTSQEFSEIVSVSKRFFEGFGITANDRYLHCLNLSLFVASPAVISMQELGVMTLWGGVLPMDRIQHLLKELQITVIQTTPSFAWKLGSWLKEHGSDPATELWVRRVIVAGEPGGSIVPVREAIEKLWGAKLCEVYGLSEIMGSIASSCPCHDGLHIAEDSVIVEVLETDSDCPVEEGKRGELTYTALNKHGRPMIRYRSGDIGQIIPGKCGCGSEFTRVRVVGRVDNNMFIVSGVNVYPSDIRGVVAAIEGITNNMRIRLRSDGFTNHYVMEVEREKGCSIPSQELVTTVSDRLKRLILARPKEVIVYPSGALEGTEQKTVFLIDERKKGRE